MRSCTWTVVMLLSWFQSIARERRVQATHGGIVIFFGLVERASFLEENFELMPWGLKAPSTRGFLPSFLCLSPFPIYGCLVFSCILFSWLPHNSTLQSYLPSLKNYNACSERWIKRFPVQTPFSKAKFSIFKFIIVACFSYSLPNPHVFHSTYLFLITTYTI